jgi:hypothetical protein
MTTRAELTERRLFKDRCMWGPGNWSTKKVQERSADQHSFTYVISGVALEGASVDLHIGTISSSDCSALMSWMFRPGNWSKESSGNVCVPSFIHLHRNHRCCSRRCKCRSPPSHHPQQQLLRPIELDVPPQNIEKVQESSRDHHSLLHLPA